jgi:hypothetical protein
VRNIDFPVIYVRSFDPTDCEYFTAMHYDEIKKKSGLYLLRPVVCHVHEYFYIRRHNSFLYKYMNIDYLH